MRHIARRKLMRMNRVSVAKKSILFLVGSSCNTNHYQSSVLGFLYSISSPAAGTVTGNELAKRQPSKNHNVLYKVTAKKLWRCFL